MSVCSLFVLNKVEYLFSMTLHAKRSPRQLESVQFVYSTNDDRKNSHASLDYHPDILLSPEQSDPPGKSIQKANL